MSLHNEGSRWDATASLAFVVRLSWIAAALILASASHAFAYVLESSLQAVEVSPKADASMPLQTRWRDENGTELSLADAMAGRPTLLLFADYTCSSLCGPALAFVSDALDKSGLASGDYRVVVIGIDAKDGPREASAMKRQQTEGSVVPIVMLSGGERAIRQAADSVGYRFIYDAARDQFAHPAAVLVLTADGHVARVLSALGISANDFRLALTEAGQGRVGTFADHVRLLCYGFDPAAGIYTLSVYRAVAMTSALTVIVLAAGIGWMALSTRRS